MESTGIVKPDNVAVSDASRHPEMTLVTCYPFYYVGSAPDRFIVKARLIDNLRGGLIEREDHREHGHAAK